MGNGKNVHLSAFAQVFFCITLITFEAPSALFEIQGDHVFTKPEGSAVYMRLLGNSPICFCARS